MIADSPPPQRWSSASASLPGGPSREGGGLGGGSSSSFASVGRGMSASGLAGRGEASNLYRGGGSFNSHGQPPGSSFVLPDRGGARGYGGSAAIGGGIGGSFASAGQQLGSRASPGAGGCGSSFGSVHPVAGGGPHGGAGLDRAPRGSFGQLSEAGSASRQPGSLQTALQYGETQLRALASQADFRADEERLFGLISSAHSYVLDLERDPPEDPRALDDAQQVAKAILRLCAAWLRLAASGGLVDGSQGLRGPAAAEMVCAIVAATVASESGLSASMLLTFNELGGLALLGSALCHADEAVLMGSVRQLRTVATRCRALAHREAGGVTPESLANDVEAFRGGLFGRLNDLAGKPGRRLRAVHFQELVSELGGMLSCAFAPAQVFEMGCMLSMQLALSLAAYCPGIPEADALEAVDWLTVVLRNLLDQGPSASMFASPVSIREWIADNGIWNTLLWRAGSRTQHHSHHLIVVLVTRHVLAPCDLVEALASLGALSPSRVPAPSRLAMQGALLAAIPGLGAEVILDLFGELCGSLGFVHLSEEGIELFVRITQRALSAGYDPVGAGHDNIGLARSLAVSHLLRYLQWGYRQQEPPEELLGLARRALLQTLAPHPALAPLLPSITAEALSLASAPPAGTSELCMSRCAQVLCSVAVDAACVAAAMAGANIEVARLSATAVARVCSSLPPVGAEAPFGFGDAQAWVAALVDSLACFLRMPGAQISAPQVGTLWSRLIVRPVFGISVGASSTQYFKLALLAQPLAGSALVAPLLAAPNPPPEVRLAHASIFCPASFEDDPPPLSAAFFFPAPQVPARQPGGAYSGGDEFNIGAAHMQIGTHADSTHGDSPPPRFAIPLRRSMSSGLDMSEVDILSDAGNGLGDEAAIAAAAASAGLKLPDNSAHVPRLRLDRVQSVIHEQSATLFGELTVYDAIERRLWDEFDERGVIEDADALRQRDAAAIRCLSALDREIDGAGVAGRELPAPLTECRAKFSRLCELTVSGAASRAVKKLRECEAALEKAEDELVEARAAFQRQVVRNKRLGEPAPTTADVTSAHVALQRATVLLVSELRLAASRATLGLVEIIGSEGLARALRLVGKGHGDPLLERLQKHSRWLAAQAEISPPIARDEDGQRTEHAKAASKSDDVPRQRAQAEKEEDASHLARPEGLSGYSDVRDASPSGHVLVARRDSTTVALKVHFDSKAASCQRELRALKALRHGSISSLLGVFQSGSSMYFELAWCAGGTLEAWCKQNMDAGISVDVEPFLRCLALFRHVWSAVAFTHGKDAIHGDLSLANVLLTSDHKPVLCDFKRCVLQSRDLSGETAEGMPRATSDYVAPELLQLDQSAQQPLPTQAGDIYAMGVMMAKAFLGMRLEVSSCPYDQVRKQRRLPDESLDVDVADFLQALLSQDVESRPKASAAAAHRSLDPLQYLRRRGLIAASGGKSSTKATERLLATAEQLREDYRGKQLDQTLMFSRPEVFTAIANSRMGDWAEDALLGEWRISLNDESGVDGGGLRREVVSLFFEQLEESCNVLRIGSDERLAAPPTLFIANRQDADKSPQQWRQLWTVVGAMILRAVSHFGNAPVALSSAVFDCALGRIKRLPPDLKSDDLVMDGGVAQLIKMREDQGDEWARSQLLDLLLQVKRAEPQKEASYRWMLAQRTRAGPAAAGKATPGDGLGAVRYTVELDALETFASMLKEPCYKFLTQSSKLNADGSISHAGAVLEWTLLWDVYLKYLGDGDRWLAYESLLEGLTARGRRLDMWAALTGDQIMEVFEGAPLTPANIVANLEFKPSYGYDVQINAFKSVIEGMSQDELSMFLRFATGIGKLPANRRFPAGQKLTIRFMPDDLNRLPSAHTCFWTVDLPPYEDESSMSEKLRQAIAAPQPFALS